MSIIRMEIVDKLYNNETAYGELIHYITKPTAIIGASGIYPINESTAIAQFTASQTYSKVQSPDEQYVFHFYITSKKFKNNADLYQTASNIALIFGDKYQVYYGIHNDTAHTHIHFAVNAYSYHPCIPTLTTNGLAAYLHTIKAIYVINIQQAVSKSRLERRATMFETYDEILLVEDVCEILKISSTQTYRLLRSGRLNGYKEGKDWKIPKIALEAYIRKRMSEKYI